MSKVALDEGDLRAGMAATRAKLKFDRQILAIARIHEQSTIYSDDDDISKLASKLSIQVIPIHELPLPSDESDRGLGLD